ncbi:glycoside hydrolase family 3 protein [Sphingopyxis sp.]|uniref:glycoside hydrolase family 3 protein n=1 Tax=Sphingopyxis sp. TaxID=1908224 RepID=UPI002D77A6E8|nr:glycoside hydrolase family 3 N-terminal domain-containing protein [Sphingopyxis sp.]HET6522877.1 glycoside hydrolase family 3 N-terminal domain-containing protein [Sphingopyxis sp.]
MLFPLLLAAHAASPAAKAPEAQPVLGSRSVPLLKLGGLTFKDMNRNGKIDPFEDWRRPPVERAHDLVKRMTAAQKAGLVVHPMAPGEGEFPAFHGFKRKEMRQLVAKDNIRFFLNTISAAPSQMAEIANDVQAIAEAQPLAIPVTFSSDPRNQLSDAVGQSVNAGQFSQWPFPTGLAATGDVGLVQQAARIASAEYRAVGIRMTMSPQADVASEPRWGRANGTFGSSPDANGKFAAAYIEGFQGGPDGVTPDGVASVVKHWVGYGAVPNGEDALNYYGRQLAFPGGRFDDHVRPFLEAFESKPAAVMLTYGVAPPSITINGRPAEQVGAGFSRQMVTELLRERYRYPGIAMTDFGIFDDCGEACRKGMTDFSAFGMPWGVEDLTPKQRIAKAFDAGVDQLGGYGNSAAVLELVRSGRVAIARLDRSVERLLTVKFQMGEFENPYVDPAAADRIVGSTEFREAAAEAQRRSLVLLKDDGKALSAARRARHVWLVNASADVARQYGFDVAKDPAGADFAFVRIASPAHNRSGDLMADVMKQGALSFDRDNTDLQAVERASASGLPLIVVAHLDRPAILTPIVARSGAVIGEFGASDAVLFDMLKKGSEFQGKLPFELPSTDVAVEAQLPDVPDDSHDPLFPRGFGLTGK